VTYIDKLNNGTDNTLREGYDNIKNCCWVSLLLKAKEKKSKNTVIVGINITTATEV